MNPDQKTNTLPRLGERGQIFVAAIASEHENPWKVRVRTRSSGLDISANVIREGKLLVVVAAHVRPY